MGLPGAGKTSLAVKLAKLLKAVHFNADQIRKEINKDLGFSKQDRIEQAKRMGALCDIVAQSGHWAIADFVCPLPETRKAFGENYFLIYVNRTPIRNFQDTIKMFVPPEHPDFIVDNENPPTYWAEKIFNVLLVSENMGYPIPGPCATSCLTNFPIFLKTGVEGDGI